MSNLNRQSIALAPDGTKVAYAANGAVYVRTLSEFEPRLVVGTETRGAATSIVFSPDGRSLLFWGNVDNGTLMRVDVGGGAAIPLCRADSPLGMSWDSTGIVFGQGAKGVMRVPASGGKPEVIARLKDGEFAEAPQMLPDGTHVLFTLAASTGADRWARARVVVQAVSSPVQEVIIEGGTDARYLPTGHIVYAVGGVLFAVAFDLARMKVIGNPVAVAAGVRRSPDLTVSGTAHFSISQSGTLIYVPGVVGDAGSQQDIAVMERGGGVQPLNLPPGAYEFPRVSPDGNRIAFGNGDNEAAVWIYERQGTSAMRRLTFGGKSRYPVWSPDGQRIAFQSDRDGDRGIFWQAADGTGAPERLTRADGASSHAPVSWSPDGNTLLFDVTTGGRVALWTHSRREKKAAPFDGVESSSPTAAMFSPDGRWVAYTSTAAGSSERIYVEPFPSTGAKYQLFAKQGDGPHHPLWSPDGRELFYIPGPGGFEAVPVRMQPTFSFGNPVTVPRGFVTAANSTLRTFDFTPDGKIVGVVSREPSGASSLAASITRIVVVLHWVDELRRRVPVRE